MSYRTNAKLIDADSSLIERGGTALVGVAFGSFILGWAVLFDVVSSETIPGIRLFDLFGIVLLGMGAGVIGIGLISHSGSLRTAPSASAGRVAGTVFGLLGFIVVGLVASQTFGLSGPFGLGWVVPALAGGIIAGLGTIVPREDIGSTVPAGVFALFAGGIILTGVIGSGWSWSPRGIEAVFDASIVVPVIGITTSLTVGWTAAKASKGFGSRGRQAGAFMFITLVVGVMLTVLALLLAYIAVRGFPGLVRGIEIGPGLRFEWPFVMHGVALTNDINGVLPAIVGTVWLVIGAITFAVPIGVGAAIFLTEYAEQGSFTAVVETATNGLWSTPSIVYGLFGLAFLVPRFGNQNSLLAGQLVLGFMLLPLVVITSREALKGVPDEYRDASAALGVNRWQTIRSVVLPAALPGVITGLILGVGRIAGETAPLLLVMAGSPTPQSAVDVLGSFQFTTHPPFITNDALLQATSALPYQLYALIAAGLGEGTKINQWSAALVLLLVVLSFYAVGIASRAYFRGKLHHE